MSNPNQAASVGFKVNDIVLIMPNAVPFAQSEQGDPVIIAFDNPPLARVREIIVARGGSAVVRCRVLRSTDIATIAAQTRRPGKPKVQRDPEVLVCIAAGVMARPVMPKDAAP